MAIIGIITGISVYIVTNDVNRFLTLKSPKIKTPIFKHYEQH